MALIGVYGIGYEKGKNSAFKDLFLRGDITIDVYKKHIK
jgi:hypothetical protein